MAECQTKINETMEQSVLWILDVLFKKIHGALNVGGKLVFSTEHSVITS